jgi:hypothetical protein
MRRRWKALVVVGIMLISGLGRSVHQHEPARKSDLQITIKQVRLGPFEVAALSCRITNRTKRKLPILRNVSEMHGLYVHGFASSSIRIEPADEPDAPSFTVSDVGVLKPGESFEVHLKLKWLLYTKADKGAASFRIRYSVRGLINSSDKMAREASMVSGTSNLIRVKFGAEPVPTE